MHGRSFRQGSTSPTPARFLWPCSRYATAVAGGQLVIPIAERFPLSRAAEAQTLAEKGKPGGKVVLLGAPPLNGR